MAQPQRPTIPPRNIPDDQYVTMASQYHSGHAVPHNPYASASHQHALPRATRAAPGNMRHPQLQTNPSYGQLNRGGQPAVESNAPPPLPPKPLARLQSNPPPASTPVPLSVPPQQAPGGLPMNGRPQRSPSRPLPNPPPPNAAVPGTSDAGNYTYIANDPRDRQIHQLKAQLSDTASALREKDMELSRCHDELVKSRQCLKEKKEEITVKTKEIEQLTAENVHLQLQAQPGRAQPQVAPNEAALNAQVQHYQRIVEEQRREIEQQKSQPPPPAVDSQELLRLRGEVQWHRAERQRMLGEIDRLKSSEAVLSMQVRTYKEDFESERRDRERANAKIELMKGEIDNLTHIVGMLAPDQGGRQQAQEVHLPPLQ